MKNNYHETLSLWKSHLEKGLDEDHGYWDFTSRVLKDGVRARVVAKSSGIWVGEGACDAAMKVAEEMGFALKVRARFEDGFLVKKGEVLCEWKGPARAVLALERPFLNLVSFASGIATDTHRLVSLVKAVGLKKTPRVTCTRKTLPGFRDLSLYAVECGGGVAHRVSLSGGILVKENHLAVAGRSLGEIKKYFDQLRARSPHGLRLESEVRDLSELKNVLKAGADVVMLDNFKPTQVREALKWMRTQAGERSVLVEVSGGVTAENIQEYCIEGVDVISVGRLTHSVKSLDFSLLVE